MPIKVNFPNHGTFWLFAETLDTTTDSPLAPLEHCDEHGQLLPYACLSLSYAHLFAKDGIRQFGKKIGTWEDLSIV